jgi:quercetin dioxygenase-like cupin family protein
MTDSRRIAHVGRSTLSNACWYGDQLLIFLLIGEDTAGQFSLVRVHGVQGAEPLPHVHTREDETIYLLEGTLTVVAGGETLRACAGETITIPRGLDHRVHYDTPEVTFLAQYSPAGFEYFFHELSAPAQYLGLPPRPTKLEAARLRSMAARYGCMLTEAPPSSEPQCREDGPSRCQ